jgi:sarcosine oxidase delta subunit
VHGAIVSVWQHRYGLCRRALAAAWHTLTATATDSGDAASDRLPLVEFLQVAIGMTNSEC